MRLDIEPPTQRPYSSPTSVTLSPTAIALRMWNSGIHSDERRRHRRAALVIARQPAAFRASRIGSPTVPGNKQRVVVGGEPRSGNPSRSKLECSVTIGTRC